MSELSSAALEPAPSFSKPKKTWVKKSWVKKSVLPGFGLSIGLAALYASLIVFIPLAGLVLKSLVESLR